MDKVYLTPAILETESDLQGILCQSQFLPEGSIEDVEREEFPW